MKTPEQKRQSMNAITHKETATHMRGFRGGGPLEAKILQVNATMAQRVSVASRGVKRVTMSAISGVETVSQIGVLRGTGGVALYSARIREADRETQKDRAPGTPKKTEHGRSQGFLRD